MKQTVLYIILFLVIALDIALHLPCYKPVAEFLGNTCEFPREIPNGTIIHGQWSYPHELREEVNKSIEVNNASTTSWELLVKGDEQDTGYVRLRNKENTGWIEILRIPQKDIKDLEFNTGRGWQKFITVY